MSKCGNFNLITMLKIFYMISSSCKTQQTLPCYCSITSKLIKSAVQSTEKILKNFSVHWKCSLQKMQK